MLPQKVMQIDYQQFSQIIDENMDQITSLHEKDPFIFVIGKIRNGLFPASIIATKLNLEMLTIAVPRKKHTQNKLIHEEDTSLDTILDDSTLLDKSDLIKKGWLNKTKEQTSTPELFITNNQKERVVNEKMLNCNYKPRVLMVDSICGTGETLYKSKMFLEEYGFDVMTYSPLVDASAQYKPDISGIIANEFFQPPWEYNSFTPQSLLERVEDGVKGSTEERFCIGFASKVCKVAFLQNFELKANLFPFAKTLDLWDLALTIDYDDLPKNFSLIEADLVHKEFLEKKALFIKENGITHFIEDDWVQVIKLSVSCPVTEILYFNHFNKNGLYNIKSRKVDIEKLLKLKF